ncbi:acyltransferase family protein [uncultured Methanobrevibacter sp.]|uniref:acyltransferase n=1 Tax=uncultured Methanobrevibacter sp. TaxID=253161 RepID=UPI00343585A7
MEFLNFDVGKNRIYWVDWLKTIAILAVLLLHCSSKYLLPELVFQPNWYCGVFFESISRFGVPLFIMVSGFLILRKNQPISSVPKRLKRVFIPFIFWLIIYVIAKFVMINHSFDLIQLGYFMVQAILDPTIASIEFWFVYMILGLYVFSPIITTWLHNTEIYEIEYFLIVWALISFVGFSNVDFLLYDYLKYFTGSIGYFILGYYLYVKQKSILKNKHFGLLLFVIGTLVSFLGTILSSMAIGEQSLLFFNLGDITPNACLQAMGIFIIVSNTDWRKYSKSINNAVVYFSIASYGVYLANVLFINILDKIISFNILGNATLTIIVEWIIVFLLCNIFIRLMSKIPVLDKFSGI